MNFSVNISHAFYYTSVSKRTDEAITREVKALFENAVKYDLNMETDDAYIKDMQTVENFLHGGSQTYKVTRFFLHSPGPEPEKSGFSGWSVLLSYFEEADIIALSFHYGIPSIETDGLIALRQSGITKEYEFGDGTKASCQSMAEDIRTALGMGSHIETSFLCEITKFGDYTDVTEIEKKEANLLYGFLTGDEGYAFVPEEIVRERLATSWGSRDFISIYAVRKSFLFLNMLHTPRHEEYLRRQHQFGGEIYGGCNPYFLLGSCPLSVNHGILFAVEFVMMLRALVSEVLLFQTEYQNKNTKSFYKRISETRVLRRKIINVLEKVENTAIAEIGELSAMLLNSQHIAPIVDQVKYLLELLEGDLTLIYSERNNSLVTLLTVLGLILAAWQVLLALQ